MDKIKRLFPLTLSISMIIFHKHVLQQLITTVIWIGLMKYSLQSDKLLQANITEEVEHFVENFQFLDDVNHVNVEYANLSADEHCQISNDNKLYVICNNIDIRNISESLPDEIKALTISNSHIPYLTKNYFSKLKNLEILSLVNNSHRFITSKAFQGLDKLRQLNISRNQIHVLKHAFKFIPNVEKIDLSYNNIKNLSMISEALCSLKNLTELRLSHNVEIRRIRYNDFLPLEVSNLETLIMFNTTIKWVEKYAFQHLHKLKLLDLSVNYLNEDTLMNVTVGLFDTEIEVLKLQLLVGMEDFPFKAFIPLANTTIKRLQFGYNSIRRVPQFPYIPTLTSLWLPGCSIMHFSNRAFTSLPNLNELILHNNEISMINENAIALPHLRKLILDNQVISPTFGGRLYLKARCFERAKQLQVLSIRSTDFGGNIERFMLFGLKHLETLRLSKAKIYDIADYSFETLVSLKLLDLFGNGIKYLTNFTFYGLNNLEILHLGYNSIFFMSGTLPLQHCPSLNILLLYKNRIEHIPKHSFSNMHNLKILTLFENRLTSWNHPLLSAQANLTLLHLSQNQLTDVTPAMMKDFERISEYLDLTRNPFNCSSCEISTFQRFLSTTNLSFVYSISTINNSTYTCMNPPELRGQLFLEANLTAYQCLKNSEMKYTSFAMVLCSVAFIAIVLFAWVFYSFRWYFRYFWFHCNAVLKERRSSSTASNNFTYDAFVSYNSADTPWIISYLIPELEQNEPQLKLCIHERDFEAGRLITENILEAIETSRKVILVLSEDFIKSEWCMLELHMAQHKLFDETRDVLLLVKLTPINHKLYTKNMSYLEKTRPCYTWTEDPMGQKLFWNKLKKQLCSNQQSRIVLTKF